MHPSSEPVVQPEWQARVDDPRSDTTRWLHRVQRFSFVRVHISVFAVGSVLLLTINLLAGSAHIWADRWITAWGLVIIIHATLAGIASLALQLMAEDDIRPASEVSWDPTHAWTEPEPAPAWPDAPPAPVTQPNPDPWQAPPPPPRDEERVSWQAASDAAWLASSDAPDTTGEPDSDPPPSDGQR